MKKFIEKIVGIVYVVLVLMILASIPVEEMSLSNMMNTETHHTCFDR